MGEIPAENHTGDGTVTYPKIFAVGEEQKILCTIPRTLTSPITWSHRKMADLEAYYHAHKDAGIAHSDFFPGIPIKIELTTQGKDVAELRKLANELVSQMYICFGVHPYIMQGDTR